MVSPLSPTNLSLQIWMTRPVDALRHELGPFCAIRDRKQLPEGVVRGASLHWIAAQQPFLTKQHPAAAETGKRGLIRGGVKSQIHGNRHQRPSPELESAWQT